MLGRLAVLSSALAFRPSAPRASTPHMSAPRASTPHMSERARRRHLKEIGEIDPIDVQIIQRQFATVRELPRILGTEAGNATNILELDDYREPSFKRLFTHKTWQRYTGGSAIGRILRLVRQWPFCLVMQATWPLLLFNACWALLVTAAVPAHVLTGWSRGLQATMQLQGAAIGLLLVFRTDNAYRRLEEARKDWSRILYLSREVVSRVLVSCEYPVTCEVARYLCSFAWSLRDMLRDAEDRDDILDVLLDAEEASWVVSQRSRPLALLGRVRQVLMRELDAGELSATQHYAIDMDVRELSSVVATCERLFSSPIPPNMARHGVRSLILWLFGIPTARILIAHSRGEVLIKLMS
uniref:Uncharacterized protein n=2 Tax=Emiliania huxleyi TaxID=2903 RepID=A0A6U9DTU1_EMIHU|mmetsp:Transcript_3360/g.10893  ORF Transcript_3360/g.10893 Transcript_3360/m.10893 type:complete len:354 (+) Transcript_3360:38-1099(+)